MMRALAVSQCGDWVNNSTHLMQGGYLSGDRYELRRATMLDLNLRIAFRVARNICKG